MSEAVPSFSFSMGMCLRATVPRMKYTVYAKENAPVAPSLKFCLLNRFQPVSTSYKVFTAFETFAFRHLKENRIASSLTFEV